MPIEHRQAREQPLVSMPHPNKRQMTTVIDRSIIDPQAATSTVKTASQTARESTAKTETQTAREPPQMAKTETQTARDPPQMVKTETQIARDPRLLKNLLVL